MLPIWLHHMDQNILKLNQDLKIDRGTQVVSLQGIRLKDSLNSKIIPLIIWNLMFISSLNCLLSVKSENDLYCYLKEIYKYPCTQLRQCVEHGLLNSAPLDPNIRQIIFSIEGDKEQLDTLLQILFKNPKGICWLKFCHNSSLNTKTINVIWNNVISRPISEWYNNINCNWVVDRLIDDAYKIKNKNSMQPPNDAMEKQNEKLLKQLLSI